jgi:hypothetical protein
MPSIHVRHLSMLFLARPVVQFAPDAAARHAAHLSARNVTETWLKFQREIGLRPQYVLMRVTCYCLYREAGLRL